jgi:hypothetical protein
MSNPSPNDTAFVDLGHSAPCSCLSIAFLLGMSPRASTSQRRNISEAKLQHHLSKQPRKFAAFHRSIQSIPLILQASSNTCPLNTPRSQRCTYPPLPPLFPLSLLRKHPVIKTRSPLLHNPPHPRQPLHHLFTPISSNAAPVARITCIPNLTSSTTSPDSRAAPTYSTAAAPTHRH